MYAMSGGVPLAAATVILSRIVPPTPTQLMVMCAACFLYASSIRSYCCVRSVPCHVQYSSVAGCVLAAGAAGSPPGPAHAASATHAVPTSAPPITARRVRPPVLTGVSLMETPFRLPDDTAPAARHAA